MKRAAPEFQLQCAVAAHLERRRRPNVYFTAIPLGEKRSAVTGARIKRMGGKAGAPDMLVLVDGRAFALELKSETGRLTMSQVATRDAWRSAGGAYGVAHDIDEALELLTAWGAIG